MPQQIGTEERNPRAVAKKHSASARPKMQNAGIHLPQDVIQRALVDPSTLTPATVMYLQRTMGNQAVSQLINRRPTRQHSQQSLSATPLGQPGGNTGSEFENSVLANNHQGTALPNHIRRTLEPKLGADLSNVKVHTDSQAIQLSRDVGAKAFTHQNHIYYGAGQSPNDLALTAHETVHTIQQGAIQQGQRDKGKDSSVRAIRPATGLTIQRAMKFKPENLKGELSKKEKISGKLGRAGNFGKLKKLLEQYWQTRDHITRYTLLEAMQKEAMSWLQKHKKGETPSEQHQSIEQLFNAVSNEMSPAHDKAESDRYMNKYSVPKGKTGRPSAVVNVGSDPLAEAKQFSSKIKHSEGEVVMDAGEQRDLNKYRERKHLKMTPAHRAALHAYTLNQYRMINPAMENNPEWLKKNVGGEHIPNNTKNFAKTPSGLHQILEDNKEIGNMTRDAMNKLPRWQHEGTIYRGETIPAEEATKVAVGYVRKFNMFVSTSKDRDFPMSMANSNRSEERPYAILYQITASTKGRDIAPFSAAPGEKEILFPPRTGFLVTEVTENDPATKTIVVNVTAV